MAAMNLPVSVYLITRNEAHNLRRLLPTLKNFTEVVLVDCGSTDATLQVAQQFANVRTAYRSWTGFSDQKNYALSLCTQPWVLNLDADEALTADYVAALQALIQQDDADALQSRRKLLRWGKAPRTLMQDDVLIRCFRRGVGHYPAAKVHERLAIRGKVKDSTALILHHENLSFSERIQKSNQYSQLKAEDKFANGKRCTLAHLLLAFPISFLNCYLAKGCCLDGGDGVLTSMNHAYYNFMKYAKLWELQAASQRDASALAASAPTPPRA